MFDVLAVSGFRGLITPAASKGTKLSNDEVEVDYIYLSRAIMYNASYFLQSQ